MMSVFFTGLFFSLGILLGAFLAATLMYGAMKAAEEIQKLF